MRSKITRLLVLWIGVFLSFSLTRTNRFTSSFGANFDFGKSVISYYNTRNKHNATKFHEDVIRDIQAVVNESTIIAWKAKDFFQFTELFDHDDVNNDNKTQYQLVWSDESRYFIHTMSGVCRVSQQFKETGSIKRHILLSHFNENWGALSTPVPNRTVNWGKLEDHWKQEGCNKTDIMEYLNHERMLAVFTTQHQAFDHPKVHSIPLGIGNPPLILNEMPKIPVQEERSELLMVNAAASSDRQSQIQLVLKSFHDAGYPLNNTYNIDRTITTTDSMKTYYNQMRKSKFIMCPSGMGWDTYRMWEALYLGTIPVVEKYNRQDGWHRTMDDLPIVWVDTFEDITPALLEKEYEKIVAGGSKRFKFAKLTIQYWKAFVESFLPGNATTDLTTSFDDMKKEDHPSNSSSHNNKNTVEFELGGNPGM